jgi:hypothetical protein
MRERKPETREREREGRERTFSKFGRDSSEAILSDREVKKKRELTHGSGKFGEFVRTDIKFAKFDELTNFHVKMSDRIGVEVQIVEFSHRTNPTINCFQLILSE